MNDGGNPHHFAARQREHMVRLANDYMRDRGQLLDMTESDFTEASPDSLAGRAWAYAGWAVGIISSGGHDNG